MRVAVLLTALAAMALSYHLSVPFLHPPCVEITVDAKDGEVWIGDYRLMPSFVRTSQTDEDRQYGRDWLPKRRLDPGLNVVKIPMLRKPGASFWSWYLSEISFGRMGMRGNQTEISYNSVNSENACVTTCHFESWNWVARSLLVFTPRGKFESDLERRLLTFVP